MDDDKHYWVERGEIEKLLSKGADWLGQHPERDLIAQRYLRHRSLLTREALARLTEEEGEEIPTPLWRPTMRKRKRWRGR